MGEAPGGSGGLQGVGGAGLLFFLSGRGCDLCKQAALSPLQRG